MIQSNLPGDETNLGYGQLFSILLRRRFWMLGVFCGVLAIAIPIALNKEPTYQSSMQLLIEPYVQQKQEGKPQTEEQFTDSNVEVDYATQLNLMRSSQLIQKAVDRLHPKYPEIQVTDIKESFSLTGVQEEDTDIKDTQTKIVKVVYTSNDPIQTQDVLAAIQTVYQDYNLQQQQVRLTEGLAFINDQLPTARDNVIQAEKALEQFRETQNLIDPVQQATTITDALSTVEQEQQAIRAQYQETQARYRVLQQQLERSPQEALTSSRLSQSPRYQALLNELQKTELAIAQQRVKFTDAEPRVEQLLEQRQRQLALLQEEAQRVLGETSTQIAFSTQNLLTEGQLGNNDLTLSSQLAEAQTTLQALQARDRSLAITQQQLRAKLNRLPELMAEYERLQPEVQIRRDTLQKLLEARQELGIEIARGGFKWQVVEPPKPGKQMGPDTRRDLMLSVVVGLFLGGLAAFGREALDDAVHSSEELKRQVALPLLGIIPELPRTGGSGLLVHLPFRRTQVAAASTLPMVYWLPFRESLDLIYKHIQLLNSSATLRSIVVTSALPSEGKSTLVVGLAFSAARLHQRVLLIDADLRRPSLHKQLNLANEQGLATLLVEDSSIPSPQRLSLSGSEIDVLTAGPIPPDPVKLLSSQRMRQLMAGFEQNYDLILVDTPPILGMVDALQAASFCNGVVIVGRISRVTQSELTEAIAMLSHLNAIGIVANGANGSTNRYIAYAEQNGSPLFQLN
ncbi:MAG TPA: capsular biosynthesis protein [Cyanobacteria bacterium UBA12227]|nr:capsular biosynthesis protein [Cyanobacteria bacterium UBA12227]HAX87659.1 capsular biosynthesis protein [Cyanobacteria bacterium UBA11370]